jgi:hypothetical protein
MQKAAVPNSLELHEISARTMRVLLADHAVEANNDTLIDIGLEHKWRFQTAPSCKLTVTFMQRNPAECKIAIISLDLRFNWEKDSGSLGGLSCVCRHGLWIFTHVRDAWTDEARAVIAIN